MSIIYILRRTNNPNICKVGRTTNTAESRAKDYTDGNWSVGKIFSVHPNLLKDTEEKAHQLLSEYWLDPAMYDGSAKEIFECDLETAEKAIERAIKSVVQEVSNDLNNLKAEILSSEENSAEKTIEDYEPTVTTRYTDVKSRSRRYASDKAKPQIVTHRTWAGECDGCHEEYSVTINRYDTVAKCPLCFYAKPLKEQ